MLALFATGKSRRFANSKSLAERELAQLFNGELIAGTDTAYALRGLDELLWVAVIAQAADSL